MKLIEIQKTLKNSGLLVFTTAEFRRTCGFSWTGARKFLLRYTRHGVFWQLKRGSYALREPPVPPWLIANKLYAPSYISLDSALSYYAVIPETIYTVTSVTTRITREFEACETHFVYRTIKPSAYGGYQPLSIDGQTVLVAEPEKALADTLYFVHLGKKELNERISWRRINTTRLKKYLKQFGRKNFTDWSWNVISKKH